MSHSRATAMKTFGGKTAPLNDATDLEEYIIAQTSTDGVRATNEQGIATPNSDERCLLELIEEGNKDTVQQFLKDHPNVDINARNYQGSSGLAIACQNQNEDVASLLLQHPSIQLGDALLYSVKEGNVHLVETLLNWQRDHDKGGSGEKPGLDEKPYHSSEFSRHMTPLMLAAQLNHFHITELLLSSGHTIDVPDPKKYAGVEFGENLELSTARIDAYKALASPTYLCLSTEDPILDAFKLSHAADKAAIEDPVFRSEYVAISKDSRDLATGLLAECRTSEEVHTLLTKDHTEGDGLPATSQYPRIELAIDLLQKEFVTHPNCQQSLQMIWTTHNPEVLWKGPLGTFIYFIPRLLLLPFVYIGYFFTAPCKPWATKFWAYWRSPMIKFLGDMVSYIVFLCLLLVSIISGRMDKRVPGINGVDICIYIWVGSSIWRYVKVVVYGGLKIFTKYWWYIFDVFTILLFLVAFAGRVASVIIARSKDSNYENLPRKYWPPFEPMLISEGFYALACVLSFGRILYWFQVSQFLGPLQLSLGRMFYDIIQIVLIFVVSVFSFAVGLTLVYGYYKDGKQTSGGKTVSQEYFFESFGESLNTLFWSLYGYGGIHYANLVVDNQFNKTHHSPVVKHEFTQGTGFLLYGLYHVLTSTILLNMLIAMMSNTLTHIQENSDTEWKFARSRLWMAYLERGGTLPPPLTLIPSPKTIWSLITWLLQCCSGRAKFSWVKCCYIEKDEDVHDKVQNEKQYKVLMKELVLRFLRSYDETESGEGVTPSDIDQMKQDLMRELQKLKNQMKSFEIFNDQVVQIRDARAYI